jgi:hypothetical protein
MDCKLGVESFFFVVFFNHGKNIHAKDLIYGLVFGVHPDTRQQHQLLLTIGITA